MLRRRRLMALFAVAMTMLTGRKPAKPMPSRFGADNAVMPRHETGCVTCRMYRKAARNLPRVPMPRMSFEEAMDEATEAARKRLAAQNA